MATKGMYSQIMRYVRLSNILVNQVKKVYLNTWDTTAPTSVLLETLNEFQQQLGSPFMKTTQHYDDITGTYHVTCVYDCGFLSYHVANLL